MVADIIADAQENEIPIIMTVVNAGEVWYIVARQFSATDADASIQMLANLGIEFIEADWTLAHGASELKTKMKMSFADCFAAALAKQRKAHLLTGDPEFKQVQREIPLIWLQTSIDN